MACTLFGLARPSTDVLAADEFTYDVGPGVPAEDVDVIKSGFSIGQVFLETYLGGDIAESIRKEITVKIVATGQGNQEPGGGGACCTATTLSPTGESVIRPFFDVAHPNWKNSQFPFWTVVADHYHTAFHEYTHAWQSSLGCIDIHNQPLGFWLNEGIAEYVAYEALIARGDMRRGDVLNHHLSNAVRTGQMGRPLTAFGGVTSDLWPGHVGYLALERLVPQAPLGLRSLRVVCEEVAVGASVPAAFATAFGVSLDIFYADFEAWRVAVLAAPAALLVVNEVNAIPGSPLRVDAVQANFGPDAFADLYLGVLLPTYAGPGFGCPNGDAVAFFSHAPSAGGVRAEASDVPKNIPDPGQIISALNFPDIGAIEEVTLDFQFSHQCERDLTMDLRHPDGTVFRVMDRGNRTCSGGLQTSASHNPSLSQPLRGKLAGGMWQLVVTDDSPEFAGTLDSWSLTIVKGSPATAVLTCLSAAPSTFARLQQNRVLPSGSVTSTVDVVQGIWPAGIPPGSYTFFGALTRAGTLDVISVSTQVVSFHP